MRMQDHHEWSVKLGRWGGVRVRLHMFSLLFAAVTMYLGWFGGGGNSPGAIDALAVASLAILCVSVLCHELGHYWAANRVGVAMHQSILVPWGGLSSFSAPRTAQSVLIVHMAGPLTNGAICLFCLPSLLLLNDADVAGLLHPLQPAGVDQGSFGVVLLKLTFWVNWLLVLVNLIPAYPFDGGQLFRAGLGRLLGRRRATLVVARVAQFGALALVVVAWFVRDTGSGGLVPVWFALTLLAIFLFFSAAQEPERRGREPPEEAFFGYDFSQGYTSLEQSAESLQDESSGPIAQWLEQRRLARQQRQRQQEAEEERRVDEILARLHRQGMASLSDEDRALLERVSARYRNRLGGRR